jgi:hypothetical protein
MTKEFEFSCSQFDNEGLMTINDLNCSFNMPKR